jgi:hypothetical protein
MLFGRSRRNTRCRGSTSFGTSEKIEVCFTCPPGEMRKLAILSRGNAG